MATIRRIDDAPSAVALADLLNGNARRQPVVVVTAPSGRTEPWIDADEIAREAGNLAEVYVMPTGPFTWEFSHRMAEGTQVYGGAGRVYPIGHEWSRNLTRSPLRFAFNEHDGERATQQLISDMFRMAASAGLLSAAPTTALRQVSGAVQGTMAGRALVDVGELLPAAIPEELVVDGVRIDRIVTPGQRIEGWYDPESHRLDVTKSLRPATEALSAYAAGEVVLTKVAAVRNGKAELVLYPKTTTPEVRVAVLRADVTTNPLDDLRTLMTVGEVIPARVVTTGPAWALVLHDVDDDEPVAPAPSLLPGGPPWLSDEPEDVEPEETQPLPAPSLPQQTPLAEPAHEAPAPEVAAAPPAPPAAQPVRPTPAMFDRNRKEATAPAPEPATTPGPRPGPPGITAPSAVPAPPVPAPPQPAAPQAPAPAQPKESTKALLLQIDGLKAEVCAVERDRDRLRTQIAAAADEREQLRYVLGEAERRANRAEHDVAAARTRLRKAGKSKGPSGSTQRPVFADREQGFRYLVLTQWATRTLPAEQHQRPLPTYLLGPEFLDSLDRLEGIKEEKVADVVFEIVTGLAPQLASREVHRLRTGTGGDDPTRTREDGAVAWRASLQVNTPSARRIHYWILPSGQIELARVSTHDDFAA